MEAWIERAGDVVVVHLKGRVDYESTEPFRQHCARHLVSEKVIFNFELLNFVGSVGITDFVTTIVTLAATNANGLKFAAVGNEFRRIFEASDIKLLQIFDTTGRALQSYQGFDVAPLPRLSTASVEEVIEEAAVSDGAGSEPLA